MLWSWAMVHSSCQRGEDAWGDGSVAQWTEHRSSEPGVAGSSPAGPTKLDRTRTFTLRCILDL